MALTDNGELLDRGNIWHTALSDVQDIYSLCLVRLAGKYQNNTLVTTYRAHNMSSSLPLCLKKVQLSSDLTLDKCSWTTLGQTSAVL